MSKKEIIEQSVSIMEQLSDEKVREINDFISFILQKYENETLQKGIEKLASESGAFDFLNDDDDDLYKLEDAIEIYK